MRTDIINKKDLVIEYINQGKSKEEICKLLNCQFLTLNHYLVKWEIFYRGHIGGKGKKSHKRKSALELLQNNGYISSHRLKLKLIEDGLKKKECERCNLMKWLDADIPLELHHKDGNHYNNTLNNLEILCPNCHALTSNHGSKNFKIKKDIKLLQTKNIVKIPAILDYCECGCIKRKKSKKCKICAKEALRKVIRPSYEQLLKEVEEFGNSAIGRKYRVSESAIRKWIKYEKKLINAT